MADVFERLKAALSDRYAIEREIGSGGMATVYLAEDLKLHRNVALKVLRPELASALGPDRFLQEIDIAAKLAHPHILPLHDCGEADGFLYYVMTYVEGQSLREKLATEGELPVAEAARILRDIVEALKHAHRHNVVHRDIKPDNVMLTEDHALVTDFGVAKAVSDATGAIGLTTEGVALGTPAYMAPEQASADPHIDHRADIYAVGVIAYELLTGRPPFVGNTQQELLAAHVTQTPDPVTRYRESVPPALAELVMKCLEKKAADRWQSTDELLARLEAFATPSGGVTPTGMIPVDRRARGKWVLAGGALAVAILMALIVVLAGIPDGGGPNLNANRVVVAELRNGTGDPSLDPVGGMAGHWITQGLQQTQVLQVVPWETALQSSQYIQSEAGAGRVMDPVRGMAEETGAGIVISGSYYLEGDSIQIQVDVNDAVDGTILGSIDPLSGSRVSPSEVLGDLQQQVMGFLAVQYDDRLAAPADLAGTPPSFEAYQAYSQGLAEYLQYGGSGGREHFRRAFELDSTWAEPLLFLVLTHWNVREVVEADSLLDLIEGRMTTLTPYYQAYFEYFRGRVDGDDERALAAIRRASAMAPGSRATYNLAFLCHSANRPAEAIDAFLSLDPERGPMRGWRAYFNYLARAYAELDQHREMLEVVKRGQAIYGNSLGYQSLEFVAQVGLGRLEEVGVLLDELFAIEEWSQTHGLWMTYIAAYERRNGYVDAARITIDRAIGWLKNRQPETKASGEWRYVYAVALYVADRCDEAYDVAKHLFEEFPERTHRRGLVGVFAACRGDEAEAEQISHWFGALETDVSGTNSHWRSVIAGSLGDGENAVAFWREAVDMGYAHLPPWSWQWLALEPIRDYEPWQALMRPKG